MSYVYFKEKAKKPIEKVSENVYREKWKGKIEVSVPDGNTTITLYGGKCTMYIDKPLTRSVKRAENYAKRKAAKDRVMKQDINQGYAEKVELQTRSRYDLENK